jgi:hypothetical protein
VTEYDVTTEIFVDESVRGRIGTLKALAAMILRAFSSTDEF